MSDEIYNVEKILAKEVRCGVSYYYIKWEGYPDEDNTWEPAINLCSILVAQWEKKQKAKKHVKFVEEPITFDTNSNIERHLTHKPRPPRIIEKIIGFVEDDDDFDLKGKTFIVQYRGKSTFSKVSSGKMRRIYPQKLIDFYESHIVWC